MIELFTFEHGLLMKFNKKRLFLPLRNKMFFRALMALCLVTSFLTGKCQDFSLDHFLKIGINNSPLIRDLNGQIRSNSVDSLLVIALSKPRVDFRGYAFYAPLINHFGYSEVLTNIANLTSVMSVSQQVFNKKTVRASLLKTNIQRQSISNTILLTENSLKKTITASYIDIWSTYSDLTLSHELISFAKEQAKILNSLTENGIYKQTDYLSFMIDLQGQELEFRELNLQYRNQISDLYLLCGIKDTAVFSPVKPEFRNHSNLETDVLPLFLRFYLDSLRIANEHLMVDRNYKPVVNWFSDAGLINNDPSVIYQNFGLSLGINITMPVYDGNQRKMNHQKLKNEENIRAGYAVAFRKEYDQQLQHWLNELEQIQLLMPAVRTQIRNSELLVNQEKELISKGSGSVTDYLIAVKNYLSVRRSLTQHEVRLLQIQNEINYWK